MNQKFTRRRFLGGLALATGSVALPSILSGCASRPMESGSYLKNFIHHSNMTPVYACTDIILQAVRNQTFTPPIATRALAMGHTAGFWAVNGIQERYTTSFGLQTGPQRAHLEVAYIVATFLVSILCLTAALRAVF